MYFIFLESLSIINLQEKITLGKRGYWNFLMWNVSAPNIPVHVSVSNEKETVMQKIKDGLYRVQVKFCEFLKMILYCFTYAFTCHFVYFFTWNCFLLINVTQVRHDESFSNAKCADFFIIWMNCVIMCIGWFWILLLLVNFYAKK